MMQVWPSQQSPLYAHVLEQLSLPPVDAAPELEPGGVPLALVADLVVEVEPSEDQPLAETLVPLGALRVELLTPTVAVPEPD